MNAMGGAADRILGQSRLGGEDAHHDVRFDTRGRNDHCIPIELGQGRHVRRHIA